MTKPPSMRPKSMGRSSQNGRDQSGRFVAGASGNPGGRPRKNRTGDELKGVDLMAALVAPVPIRRPDGKVEMVSYPLAHIMKLQERALKGDAQASRELTMLMVQHGVFAKIKQELDHLAIQKTAQEEMLAHIDEMMRREGKSGG